MQFFKHGRMATVALTALAFSMTGCESPPTKVSGSDGATPAAVKEDTTESAPFVGETWSGEWVRGPGSGPVEVTFSDDTAKYKVEDAGETYHFTGDYTWDGEYLVVDMQGFDRTDTMRLTKEDVLQGSYSYTGEKYWANIRLEAPKEG